MTDLSAGLRWLCAKPSELADAFYSSNVENTEPRRVTGAIVGLGEDGTELLKRLKEDAKKGNELTLKMKMNSDGSFRPSLRLKDKDKKKYYFNMVQPFVTTLFVSRASGKESVGVSSMYKNEVCINWLKLPYKDIVDSLFSTGTIQRGSREGADDQEQALHMSQDIGPQRVREFIIPNFDINAVSTALKHVSDPNKVLIHIHYGFSSGNINLGGIGFTPVLEVMVVNPSNINENIAMPGSPAIPTEDSTFLDFVHANPPYDN